MRGLLSHPALQDVNEPLTLLLDVAVFALLTLVLLWVFVYVWVNWLGPCLHAQTHAGLPTTTLQTQSHEQLWQPASPQRATAIHPKDLSPPRTTGSFAASDPSAKYHAESPAGPEDHRSSARDTRHKQPAGSTPGNWVTSLASRLQDRFISPGGPGDQDEVAQHLLGDEEEGTSTTYADHAILRHGTSPAEQQTSMHVPTMPVHSGTAIGAMAPDSEHSQLHSHYVAPSMGYTPAIATVAAATAASTATTLQLPTAGASSRDGYKGIPVRSPNMNMTQQQMWQRLQAQRSISAASDDSSVAAASAARTTDQSHKRLTTDKSFAFDTLRSTASHDHADGKSDWEGQGDMSGARDGMADGDVRQDDIHNSMANLAMDSVTQDAHLPDGDFDRSTILLDSADLACLLSGSGTRDGGRQGYHEGVLPPPKGLQALQHHSMAGAQGSMAEAAATPPAAMTLGKGPVPASGSSSDDAGVLGAALRMLQQSAAVQGNHDMSGKEYQAGHPQRTDKASSIHSAAQSSQGRVEQQDISIRSGGLFGALQQAVQGADAQATQAPSAVGSSRAETAGLARNQPPSTISGAASQRTSGLTQAQSALSTIGRKMQAVVNYVEPDAPPVTPSPANRATRPNSPDETQELKIPMAVVTPEGSLVHGHLLQPATHPQGLGINNMAATAPVPAQLFSEGPLSLGRYLVATDHHAGSGAAAAQQTVHGFDLEHSAAAAQAQAHMQPQAELSPRSILTSRASMPLPSSLLTAVVSPRHGSPHHDPQKVTEPSFSLFVPPHVQQLWPAGRAPLS